MERLANSRRRDRLPASRGARLVRAAASKPSRPRSHANGFGVAEAIAPTDLGGRWARGAVRSRNGARKSSSGKRADLRRTVHHAATLVSTLKPPRLRRFARSTRSTAPAETSSFQAQSSAETAFPFPRTRSAPPRETMPGSPAIPASGATCAAASPPGRRFPSRARNALDPSPARSETNTALSRLRRSRSLSSRALTCDGGWTSASGAER